MSELYIEWQDAIYHCGYWGQNFFIHVTAFTIGFEN